MKRFFDTSVLVPVFYGDHVHHKPSLDLFIQFDKDTGCCGAHSLAEVYSTLTRMPGKHRISAEQALLFMGSIRERLSIIGLSGDEYADALTESARRALWRRNLRRDAGALRTQGEGRNHLYVERTPLWVMRRGSDPAPAESVVAGGAVLTTGSHSTPGRCGIPHPSAGGKVFDVSLLSKNGGSVPEFAVPEFAALNSLASRVLTSVRNGAAIGAVKGAFTGFVSGEVLGGGVTFGLSGLAGAGVGAFLQGTIGATTGVITGFASAEACQAAGAYAP